MASGCYVAIDLSKYLRAACPKHGKKRPHTGDAKSGRCIDCKAAVVKMTNPDRWEAHAAED